MHFLQYIPVLIHARINLKNLQKILQFDDFWPINHVNDETEEEQIRIYHFVRNCSKFSVCIGTITLVSALAVPVLSETRELPLLYYHFVDYQKSPYYQISYVLQVCTVTIIFTFIDGIVLLMFYTLCFTYCQLLMLKTSLKNLNFENMSEETCFNLLKEYINYYSKILKLVIF